MPIRFRCVFCNQLMGISRRKVGTVVRCPVCASSVTVPDQPNAEDAARGPSVQKRQTDPAASPPLFEQSDFDQLFNAPKLQARPDPSLEPPRFVSAVPVVPNQTHAPANIQTLLPEMPVAYPPGILITPKRATFLSVAAVVALAAAFVLGLWVATLLHSRPG